MICIVNKLCSLLFCVEFTYCYNNNSNNVKIFLFSLKSRVLGFSGICKYTVYKLFVFLCPYDQDLCLMGLKINCLPPEFLPDGLHLYKGQMEVENYLHALYQKKEFSYYVFSSIFRKPVSQSKWLMESISEKNPPRTIYHSVFSLIIWLYFSLFCTKMSTTSQI